MRSWLQQAERDACQCAGLTTTERQHKVSGITMDITRKALEQARHDRLHILGKMAEMLSASRAEISSYAPRIITIPSASLSRIGNPSGGASTGVRLMPGS